MPAELPTSDVASCTLTLEAHNQVSAGALGGPLVANDLGIARWRASYTLAPMQETTARAWCAFLAGLRSRVNTLRAVDSGYTCERGADTIGTDGLLGTGVDAHGNCTGRLFPATALYPAATGLYPTADCFSDWTPSAAAVAIAVDADADDAVVAIDGLERWDYSTYGVNPAVEADTRYLRRGDMIQVEDTLHVISGDVWMPDTCGGATGVMIEPPLRVDIAEDDAVNLLDPGFVGRLQDDNQTGWDVGDARIYGLSFDVVEVI